MKNLLLGLSLALMASAASAADLGIATKAPAGQAPVSFNWQGPSIWGSVGYIDSSASSMVDSYGEPTLVKCTWKNNYCGQKGWPKMGYALVNTPAQAALDQTAKGLALGGGLGYDIYLSPLVIAGLEADLYWSSASDSQSILTTQYNRKLTMLGFYGARLGWVATPTTLIFVKAGGAVGNFQQSITSPSGTASASDTLWGWAAGGGVQQMISRDGMFVKLEGTYSGFRDQCFAGSTLCAKDNVVMGMASLGKKF